MNSYVSINLCECPSRNFAPLSSRHFARPAAIHVSQRHSQRGHIQEAQRSQTSGRHETSTTGSRPPIIMHDNHDPNIMLCRHIATAQIDATGQIIIAIQAQAIKATMTTMTTTTTMSSIIYAIAISWHQYHCYCPLTKHKLFTLNHHEHGILHLHRRKPNDEQQPRSRMPLSFPGINQVEAAFTGMVLLAPKTRSGRGRARRDADRSTRDGDGDRAFPVPTTTIAV